MKSSMKEKIVDLEEKIKWALKCEHVACLQHGKWDQCHNHSHALCAHFEEYYEKKDLNNYEK